MARGLVIGLVLGVAVGWLVWRVAPSPLVPTEEIAREVPDAPGTPPETPAAATLAGAPATAPVPPVSSTEEASALDARLTVARESRDFPTFLAALAALGAANTPEADRVLISVMADDALGFPQDLSQHFLDWLEDSESTGIVEAAKTRLNVNVPGHGTRPWLLLVGRHGDLDDLAWARAELEPHKSILVMQGMAASRDAAARKQIRAELADMERFDDATYSHGRWWLNVARALAVAHPDEGVPILMDALDRKLAGGRGSSYPSLLRTLYDALHPDRLEEFRDILASMKAPDPSNLRLEMLRHACMLDLWGVNIDSLRHLTEKPAATLLRIVTQGGPQSEEDRHRMTDALRNIQLLQPLQTERNLDLVEQTLDTLDEENRKQFTDLLRELPAMRARSEWQR